jgi:hypothetical protein
VLGTGDDTHFTLNNPGTTTPYYASGIHVDGNRVAWAASPDIIIVDAGLDGEFNTTDDVEYRSGPTTQVGTPFVSIAGNYVAWLSGTAANGMQVWVGDFINGTQRQVSDHYSSKYQVSVEPSARVLWEDRVFTSNAVFVSAP